MTQDGSVTRWIHGLKAGASDEVQQQLWNRYFERLVQVARGRLSRDLCRVEDEEDVVLSVFDSFFARVQTGQFPELNDRSSLWPLLVAITVCKTKNLHRRQRAQKRDAFRAVSASPGPGKTDWLEQLADQEPTPEMAAETAEEANRMLETLEKESLQSVARMKLEGYTNREIAERLGVMERTIERRLTLIRQLWTEFAEASLEERPAESE
ncbi:sigma-70 family RNA polymerase sigma factor [Lignipirellula cremea]|uniref:RNA polymerase sigma factor n=1 Tax=Lignipirellula cremea TaxID=2528010 RepID=A0A518DL50_9BACT|nr:sigma-70 family RNA polymerase sigma factor [Lignipirellula cremea]QDU92569.1 RNA polymerase sigma factor [Lignipirellula cremea]